MRAIERSVYNSGQCAYMDCYRDEEPCLCTLTERSCIGFDVVEPDKVPTFSDEQERRCPMYNLDFKRIIGKNISDMIREYRTK